MKKPYKIPKKVSYVSDEDNDEHVMRKAFRKVDILEIDCSDDEFILKHNCKRRKSFDFLGERREKLS